jgi:hypothetical protein
MATSQEIQDIIARLARGEQVSGWDLTRDNNAGAGTYSSPESGYTPLASGAVTGASFYDQPNHVWHSYDPQGTFAGDRADSSWKDGLSGFLKSAALIGGAGFGLNALGGALGGGLTEAALGGADAAAGMGVGGSAGGADLASIIGGSAAGGGSPFVTAAGAGLTGVAPGMSAADLGILGFGAGDIGAIGGLTGAAATGFGSGGLSAADLGGAAAKTSGLGDWLSDPSNILKTIGTVGSLYEGLHSKDGTSTTTRTLDPRVEAQLFGADGKGGILKDLNDWKAMYPTGESQTTINGRQGLLNFANDPATLAAFKNQGAVGLGLLNTPQMKNPWLTGG